MKHSDSFKGIALTTIPHLPHSFITYRSCRNLDGKHTIFGKVVGGLDTLNEMEKIEVDNRDRPIEDIVLQRAEVFVDPFKEADEQLAEQRSDELEQKRLAVVEEERRKQRAQPAKVYRQGVGKYLNKEAAAGATASAAAESMSASTAAAAALDLPVASVKKAKRSADYRFNDFSAW